MRHPLRSQEEELDVRLLLFRGCRIVESSRDGVILHYTAAPASSQQQRRRFQIVGLPLFCLVLPDRNASPYLLARIRELKAQSTRLGPWRGLAIAPWCTRGPPVRHATKSAREDRRPRLERKLLCSAKKVYEQNNKIHEHIRQYSYRHANSGCPQIVDLLKAGYLRSRSG